MIKLSVVIPAYNEESNIKLGVLESISKYLSEQKFDWEVLIVDDGSTDSTVLAAEKFSKIHPGFRVLKEPHRGKGGTVIAGMLAAKGEKILFTDMDQAAPITELDKFFPKFENGYDIVIGSRTGRKGAPLVRKIMAYGFTFLRLIILRLPYKDTQCGFKGFTKSASEKIFKRMQVYGNRERARGAAVTAGFDLELLYIARKLGLKVAEVPVVWHHKATERINPIKDSWEGLTDLLRVRINALKGKYKMT